MAVFAVNVPGQHIRSLKWHYFPIIFEQWRIPNDGPMWFRKALTESGVPLQAFEAD